ncbi:hypothetical protein ACMYZ8_12800, partial [Bacteroides sp. KG156]
PIATISNDSWWSARASETVTRIFPLAGYISLAAVSGSGTLNVRGNSSCYWSGSENGSSHAGVAYFDSHSASASGWSYQYNGFAVRLFSSE